MVANPKIRARQINTFEMVWKGIACEQYFTFYQANGTIVVSDNILADEYKLKLTLKDLDSLDP